MNHQVACQRALHHVAHLVALIHLRIILSVAQAVWKVLVTPAYLQVAVAIIFHQASYPALFLQFLHQKAQIHIVHHAVIHHHHVQARALQVAAPVPV
mgnify:CR=1 FL=1